MGWRERLRPASYGGAPFFVDSSERSGGRRVGVHEFPQRDTPYVEDLGRAARTLRVEGFVLGEDYAESLRRLVDRLEGPGPGFPLRAGRTLVHPLLGDLLVVCQRYGVRDLSSEEGRFARVSMEFVEAGDELQPFQSPNPEGEADGAAAEVADAGGAEFGAAARVEGEAEEARVAVEDQVRELVRIVRSFDVFSGPTRRVAALEDTLTTLATSVSELVTAPADLFARCRQALNLVLAAAENPLRALDAYRALFPLEGVDVPGSSDQSAAIRDNSALAARALRLLALGGAVRAASRASWESVEEALAARASLEVELDRLQAEADDPTFLALARLRAALAGAVPPPGEELPNIVEVLLPQSTPALVLAHRLYQNAGRDAEIVARNRARHPLRLPALEPLEVLSR